MRSEAIRLLGQHSVLSLATVRPDGWPQVTTVSYANDGLEIFFIISRSSQKYSNIKADNRVSACLGSEPGPPELIRGLSMAGTATEALDEPFLSHKLRRLNERHPGYFDIRLIDMTKTAMICLTPKIVSVVDYSLGLGHQEVVTINDVELEGQARVPAPNWGATPA